MRPELTNVLKRLCDTDRDAQHVGECLDRQVPAQLSGLDGDEGNVVSNRNLALDSVVAADPKQVDRQLPLPDLFDDSHGREHVPAGSAARNDEAEWSGRLIGGSSGHAIKLLTIRAL